MSGLGDERDLAMLLALGLRDDESGAGQPTASEEAMAAEIVAALALTAEPTPPPPALKARLLDRVAHDHPPGLGAIRKNEGTWRESKSPGVSYKVLYRDKKANLVTQLVRMAPGARFPAHLHGGDEQCLIIEGDLRHNGHVYTAGDFTWAEADTVDPELHTVDGNLLLIIGSPATKMLTP